MHGMSSVPKLPAELPSLGISLSRASGFSEPPPWNSKASVQKGHGDRRRRRELAQQAADPRLTMRLVGALGAGSASSTSGSNSRTLGSPTFAPAAYERVSYVWQATKVGAPKQRSCEGGLSLVFRLWLLTTPYALHRLKLRPKSDSHLSWPPSSSRCSIHSGVWPDHESRCTWKSSPSATSWPSWPDTDDVHLTASWRTLYVCRF